MDFWKNSRVRFLCLSCPYDSTWVVILAFPKYLKLQWTKYFKMKILLWLSFVDKLDFNKGNFCNFLNYVFRFFGTWVFSKNFQKRNRIYWLLSNLHYENNKSCSLWSDKPASEKQNSRTGCSAQSRLPGGSSYGWNFVLGFSSKIFFLDIFIP